MQYTIDATGKSVGRIASEAAKLLRGTNRTNFSPNQIPVVEVRIINASLLRMPSRAKRPLRRHSQYPGGFRETPRIKVFIDNPIRFTRETVSGMLPKNRLRSRMLRRLKVFLGDAPRAT